jgi:hypothetical protein
MCEKTMCRACGQPLPPQSREGIWLPAMKAQIFDFIDKHPGIALDGIAYHFGIKSNTVRQHVYQINSMLAATSIRICGKQRGTYRLFRPSVVGGKATLPAR